MLGTAIPVFFFTRLTEFPVAVSVGPIKVPYTPTGFCQFLKLLFIAWGLLLFDL